MSGFSAILFFLAFLLTRVRRIAHVRMLHAHIKIVAAKTIQPPHSKCGMNSRMSTKKASRVMSKVGKLRISSQRRYRGECAAAWKCDAAARMVQMRVMKAATGWTMRIAESECLVGEGSVKLPSSFCPYRLSCNAISLTEVVNTTKHNGFILTNLLVLDTNRRA